MFSLRFTFKKNTQILINVECQKHAACYLAYSHNGDILDPLLQYKTKVQQFFTHEVCTPVSHQLVKLYNESKETK